MRATLKSIREYEERERKTIFDTNSKNLRKLS